MFEDRKRDRVGDEVDLDDPRGREDRRHCQPAQPARQPENVNEQKQHARDEQKDQKAANE
jgi:hypothetical protein